MIEEYSEFAEEQFVNEPLSIKDEVKNARVIVVVGPPSAGKTTLVDQIQRLHTDVDVMHTDDYIPYGFQQSVYVMLDEIPTFTGRLIIEGVQTARLLRAGLKSGWRPDLIVEVIASREQRVIRYFKRDGKQYPFAMEKSITKVFDEYKKLSGANRPKIIPYVT